MSADRLGAKVYFCSNSFAACRCSVLLELGGFRRDLMLGDDAEFATRAVHAGYANLYFASAVVHHSHRYGTGDVFLRNFDTGVFFARNPWMRVRFGLHGGEGWRCVKSELGHLAAHSLLEIARALLHTVAKAVGYRLRRRAKMLPDRPKPLLSRTPGYWRRPQS